MKHLRFSFAMAILWMPLVLFAQYLPLTKTNKIEMPKAGISKLQTGELPTLDREKFPVLQRVPQTKAQAFSTIDELSGFYIQRNYDLSGNTRNPSVSINPASETTITIENFSGLGKDITATVDLENNKISIEPQIVYESNNTTLYLYTFNAETGVISKTDPLEGSIGKDGITLGTWGCFSKDARSYANLYAMSQLLPSNGIMTTVDYKDKTENEFPVYIEQPFDNILKIANFGNTGSDITVNLYPDKTFSITPQFMFTASGYGDFYCYYTEWKTEKFSKTYPIQGTGTDKTMKLGNWGILFAGQRQTVIAGGFESSTITLDGITITYPQGKEAAFEGEGTEASPYLIKTMDQLIALEQSVNKITGTPNDYKGKFFRLENDLDAKSHGSTQLLPIGNSINYCRFAGTFDGNGKKISNLTLNVPEPGLCGLFGIIDPAGSVKDLTLENIDYTASGENVGGIAGASFGAITLCKASGKITANAKNVGGIVGYLENEVSQSSFEGTITSNGNVGGIVGLTYGNVNKCWARANIGCSYASQTRYMGGVVGGIYGSQTGAKINDCYFSGMIVDYVDQVTDNGTISYQGGVAGLIYKSEMRRCFNAGHIIGTAATGQTAGVVGILMSSEIIDCYNAGSVSNTNSEHTGGIVGYSINITSTEFSTIKNVYSSGNVATKSTFKYKEIIGEMKEGDTLENFYFDGRNYGTAIPEHGLTTSQMTQAKYLEGFDTSVWNFSTNVYPRLKGIDNNNAAYLSMATILLSENEFLSKVKTPFRITTDNTTWSVLKDGKQGNEGHGIIINGSKIEIKPVFATDTIYAFNADKEYKSYLISIVPKVFDGDGTADTPYLIRNLDDLKTLANATVEHTQHFEGDYFLMINDIDVAGDETFTGIAADGKSSHYFSGTFNGGKHTIHNFKLKSVEYLSSGKVDMEKSRSGVGFIGYLSPTGTLKNLTIADDCSFEFYAFSAPLVGYNGGTIENCKNYADVKGASAHIGGITGYSENNKALIRNCLNSGNINGGYYNTGGIAGINLGIIEICQNNGNITGNSVSKQYKDGEQFNVGGITGANYGEIYDALNTGNVASYKAIGGIAGVNYARNTIGSIMRSVNYGYINPLTDISTCGSIVGDLESKTELKDNYYDLQIVLTEGANDGPTTGCSGVNTSVLTGGTLDGLDSEDIWYIQAGAYPLLKVFKDDPKSVAASHMFVTFTDGENRISIKTNATLNKYSGLGWKLSKSEQFKINEQVLNLTLPENDIALDTLTATYGNYHKEFYLRAVPPILPGKGTKNEPWLVKTAADMDKIYKFAADKVDFNHEYFRVENDIDFTGIEYHPIAAEADVLKFQGYFDGNGKKFTNLKYVSSDPLEFKTGRYKGLFGIVGSNGTIANLTIESNSSFTAFGYSGAFAGGLRGKIINCVNKAPVSTVGGANNIGGIAGYVYEGGIIQKCSNYADITSNTGTTAGITGKTEANTLIDECFNSGTISAAGASSGTNGGIVGVNGGTIQNCTNEGTINANSSNVAGIAAKNNANAAIINCVNKGTITGNSNYAAGIVSATLADNVVKDCVNSGEVNVPTIAGGIIGQSRNGAVLTVDNCHNTGKITTTKTNAGGIIGSLGAGTIMRDCWNEADITGTGTIGGVVGTSSGMDTFTTLIKRCYNTGKVISNKDNAGGVVGNIGSNVDADSLYNIGEVYAAASYAGGITASNGLYLSNCWNSGNVTAGESHSGGICALGLGDIVNCVNLGNVTVEGNTDKNINAGGIIAKTRAILTNCYNMGNVTAYNQAGGLYGQIFDNGAKAEAYRCYNTGKVTITNPEGTAVGNIVALNPDFLVCEDVYYDKELVAKEYENDKDATGLTSREMIALDLGEDWLVQTATYPTLKTLKDYEATNLSAASILLTESDTPEKVTEDFLVGTPAGVSWSASDHITFNGNDAIVDPDTKATVTLTATAGDYQKSYTLVLETKKVGIASENIGKVIVEQFYYTTNGVKIEKPEQGINIVVTIYDDGSVENSKVLINENTK
ncbi:hypothetical protein H8744_04475 [Oscillospiraceae bacterium N12]|jgi:hypothetical protein|uniref:Uncharacterized protein n=1 Tax=Jilunia laotingensis TaxID=2763675 RepID=A0A926F0P7_9BACT|nr:hypothetical protein [Jilunia laotingensis]MBC8592511.1 hypothetical protein [Jilunia laotingensis]